MNRAIRIGNNVTDIMKVLTVIRCQKERTEDGYELVYYVLVPPCSLLPARKGDWLVEQGKWWVVLTDKEYKQFQKNNGHDARITATIDIQDSTK